MLSGYVSLSRYQFENFLTYAGMGFLQLISWLPLDVAAKSLLEVGLERTKPFDQTLHLFHPRPIPWTTAFETIAAAMEPVTGGKRLPLVPFKQWFDKLEGLAAGASSEDMVRIPGLKLLDFYRGMALGDETMRAAGKDAEAKEAFCQAMLSTKKIQRKSATMKNVGPMGTEDVQRWVQYWTSKGLFGRRAQN